MPGDRPGGSRLRARRRDRLAHPYASSAYSPLARRPRRRRWPALLVFALALAAAIWIGRSLLSLGENEPHSNPLANLLNAGKPGPGGAAELPAPPDRGAGREAPAVPAVAIASGTRVVLRTEYQGCTGSETRPPDPAWIGLTLELLRREMPGWTIEAFSAQGVLLSRTLAEPCPDLARPERHLAIRDGKTVLLYGPRDPSKRLAEPALVDRVLELPLATLSEELRRALETGIDFPTREAALAFLEGD